MKSKSVAATIAVIIAIGAIVAVLGIKLSGGGNSPAIDVNPNYYEEPQASVQNEYPVFTMPQTTDAPWWESIFGSEESTTEEQTEQTTDAEETTLLEELTEVTEIITEVTELIGAQFSEVFDMPNAPKYIPPDIDVNFDKTAIASYKYDPDGNYYYTDDKAAWQSNFGFNEGYDSMAPVTMMFYDTVRTKFNYGGKEWMVQTWKGQYGYAFVGGEIGLYTRKAGSGGSHYNCASKEDWLKMEMLFMWDETGTGVYEPIFQRPYADYWWCTGFVVGFDGHKNRHQFRLMTRITFKDTEMANAFCEAFEANGFTRLDYLDENCIDSFVQVGNEVGFVWQNITHK